MWAALRKGLDTLATEFDRNGGPDVAPFVLGDQLSFADFIIAGRLMWSKLVLPKEEWALLQGLNGGRWGRLMKELEPYETVV